MSYAIDIYRKQLNPVKSIFDFGFYVSFFPQLVAGPIVRASEFIPQIYQPYKVTKRIWSCIILDNKWTFKEIFISGLYCSKFCRQSI